MDPNAVHSIKRVKEAKSSSTKCSRSPKAQKVKIQDWRDGSVLRACAGISKTKRRTTKQASRQTEHPLSFVSSIYMAVGDTPSPALYPQALRCPQSSVLI